MNARAKNGQINHGNRIPKINYQQAMHATAVDIDLTAVHMAYIQLSLLHVPAVVVHGNSLSLAEWDRWYTPAHILGGWGTKLAKREPGQGQPVVPRPVEVVDVRNSSVQNDRPTGQMRLF